LIHKRPACGLAIPLSPVSSQPRIVGDKVMMPADLKRLHKYMLEIER
jgi:hypothetical protein